MVEIIKNHDEKMDAGWMLEMMVDHDLSREFTTMTDFMWNAYVNSLMTLPDADKSIREFIDYKDKWLSKDGDGTNFPAKTRDHWKAINDLMKKLYNSYVANDSNRYE